MKIIITISVTCVFLISLCLFFTSSCRNETEEEQFQRYVGKPIPDSVKNIEIAGVDSLGGANKIFSFEISNTDLIDFLKDNNYTLSEGELLKQSSYPYRDKEGEIKTRNGLEMEKISALKKGIIADKVYVKKGSKYSHFWVLILDKDGTKVYFRYYRV